MKKTINKPITQAQIKAIQSILSKKGFDSEMRHDLIDGFTSGRTRSTKDLSFDEARKLIEVLMREEQSRIEKDVKKVLSAIYKLSFDIDFLNKGYEDGTDEDRAMNIAKINRFTREKGKFRKNVSQMSLNELKETKTQFEALARKMKS